MRTTSLSLADRVAPFVLIGDSFGVPVALASAIRRPPGLKGVVTSGGLATNPIDDIWTKLKVMDDDDLTLLWKDDTHQTNNEATLERFFRRLDEDGAGGLGRDELAALIGYYDKSNHGREAPRLPPTWA